MTALSTQARISRLLSDPYARAMLYPHTFAEYASQGAWKAWDFWRFIGQTIARAVIAGGARLVVNLPPGMGKSTFLSEWVPIWFLENWAAKRVIITTNGQKLAEKSGRIVRNEFDNNPLLRTRLAEDSKAKSQWNTQEGGGMKAASVGTSIIGFRAHLFLIDDPYGSWADAYSAAYREELETWFDSTVRTRLEPGASVILLHHRFASNDLTAHLAKNPKEKWTVVSLPSLAEENDPMGRAVGEPLCPERYSKAELESVRDAMASIVFDAMHQQRPHLVGSGACYRNFSGANIDESLVLDTSRPVHISLDYNINPGMHAIIGQYVEHTDTITAVHEIHAPRMTIGACMAEAKKVIDAAGRFPEWHVFADPAGTASSAVTGESHHAEVKRFLNANGIQYRWRVRTAHNPVIDRVNAVNDAHRGSDNNPHYRVHPSCKRLINDYTNVQADDQGKPLKKNADLTHASDADGYRVEVIRPIRTNIEIPKAKFSL